VSSVEPIPPEQARAILDQAMNERLGENWQDDDSGWALITGHDFMARVTRGSKNVDFYVDLLGNVSIEEKEISPAQSNGRTVAWALLLVSLGLAYLLARVVGWF
jgi:hypothetical protein